MNHIMCFLELELAVDHDWKNAFRFFINFYTHLSSLYVISYMENDPLTFLQIKISFKGFIVSKVIFCIHLNF